MEKREIAGISRFLIVYLQGFKSKMTQRVIK